MINQSMTIGSILVEHPEMAIELMRAGILCLGCPWCQKMTLAEECKLRGLRADYIVEHINELLGG